MLLLTSLILVAGEFGAWHLAAPFERSKEAESPLVSREMLQLLKAQGPGPDLSRGFRGRQDCAVEWRQLRSIGLRPYELDEGVIDFHRELAAGAPSGSDADQLAYLYRRIESEEAQVLELVAGSDDGLRIWLNSELVHEVEQPRGLIPDQDRVRLELVGGVNHLLVEVAQEGGAWSFHMSPPLGTDADALRAPIARAIERGVRSLIDRQFRDGSWRYASRRYHTGQTALCTYTLMRCGLGREHPTVRRALNYIESSPEPDLVYSMSAEALALSQVPERGSLQDLKALTEDLIELQVAAGFGYPGSFRNQGDVHYTDLSNTQFAALAMWAAARAGVKIRPQVWLELATATLSFQNPDGGFSYARDGSSSGSMTAAALFCLTVVRDVPKALTTSRRREVDQAREQAHAWLAEHFPRQLRTDPGAWYGRWWFNFLYGVERVASLEGLDKIGDCDWYLEGARHLVLRQGILGDWRSATSGDAEFNTCFALLFLARATAPRSGDDEPSPGVFAAHPSPQGIRLRARGRGPFTVWVELDKADVVERVIYSLAGRPLAEVRAKEGAATRFAAKLEPQLSGRQELSAEVHWKDGSAVSSTDVLDLRADHLWADWMETFSTEVAPRLEDVKVSASSSLDREHDPSNAVDGKQARAWLCSPEDENPRLVLEFSKPTRVAAVVLSPATGQPITEGLYDRILSAALHVDRRKEPFVITLTDSPFEKAVFKLPKAQRVSRLEVEILDRRAGTQYRGVCGLSEIEIREHSRRR